MFYRFPCSKHDFPSCSKHDFPSCRGVCIMYKKLTLQQRLVLSSNALKRGGKK